MPDIPTQADVASPHDGESPSSEPADVTPLDETLDDPIPYVREIAYQWKQGKFGGAEAMYLIYTAICFDGS